MTLNESRAHYKNIYHLSDTIPYTPIKQWENFYFSKFGGELSHAENSNSEWVEASKGAAKGMIYLVLTKIHVLGGKG